MNIFIYIFIKTIINYILLETIRLIEFHVKLIPK